MNNRVLLKSGGVCAFALVILFAAILVVTKVTGGSAWRAWVPAFSIFICLYVVVLLAAYDYLKETDYALARIGFAFGLLLIVVLFAEVAAWGADQMMLREGFTATGTQLSPMLALFTSTHTLAIWFHGLWMGLWGAALIRHSGKAKVAGALMLLFAFLYSIFYLLLRLGSPLAELAHSGGSVALLISHWLLGMLLLEASKRQTSGRAAAAETTEDRILLP
jgi:hypothetical protein